MTDTANCSLTVPLALAQKTRELLIKHDGSAFIETKSTLNNVAVNSFYFEDHPHGMMVVVNNGILYEADIPFDFENESGPNEIEEAAHHLRFIDGQAVETIWVGNRRNPDIDELLHFLETDDRDGLVAFIQEHAKKTIPQSWSTQTDHIEKTAVKHLICP